MSYAAKIWVNVLKATNAAFVSIAEQTEGTEILIWANPAFWKVIEREGP